MVDKASDGQGAALLFLILILLVIATMNGGNCGWGW